MTSEELLRRLSAPMSGCTAEQVFRDRGHAFQRIVRLENKVRAADKLAAEVEHRLNDLGGYDGRFPVRQALEDYKKEPRL